jgi:hypothetical protein
MQRELTERERRAVNLCKRFEEALDRKQLTVSLHAKEDTVKTLLRVQTEGAPFRVLRFAITDAEKREYCVTWTIENYYRYLLWVLALVDMTLMMDGSLRTSDGLTVTQADLC